MIAAVTAVFTGGVSVGGVRYFINGTKLRLTRLEEQEHDHLARLVRLETKIDTLLERL
jgi:hypothetical protein